MRTYFNILISFFLLTTLCMSASEYPFHIQVAHDTNSSSESGLELYFFNSLEDSIIFSSSLHKPKNERHKSILQLGYLADLYLKKGKRKKLSLNTHDSIAYFVAVHAPENSFIISCGQVSPDDRLTIKVNNDGSLGYAQKCQDAVVRIGWKDS